MEKTRILIQRIFEDAFPVSRSQARRLYNRLEEFQEVELDFAGVDEIGQGFADELFSKFTQRNPWVHLLPLNTNPQIDKMILHVQKKK